MFMLTIPLARGGARTAARTLTALLGTLCLLAGTGAPAPALAAGAGVYPATPPAGRLPPQARPRHYDVDLTVDPRRSSFGGTVEITVALDVATSHLWLHGNGLKVSRAAVRPANAGAGEVFDARWTQVLPSGVARLDFAREIGPGSVVVIITYTASFDRNLAGLFAVEEQGEWYALAKSESIQARRFLPGFDEPGFKAPFDVTLTVPAGNAAIGNGPEIGREAVGNGMERVTFATTRPLSTYLLSLAVGPFDVVERPPIPANAVRGDPIPLRGIARKGRGDGLAYVLDITPEFVRILEESLRSAYPYAKLDIVAAPQWPSGATELAAAISYREERILVEGKPSPAVRRALISVHAHELAHMWFGNVVTPPWWDDLWLKEGFATWATPFVLSQWEPEAGHDLAGRARTVSAMQSDSLNSVRRVREPITANDDIRNAYTAIPYVKGAALIAMADAYFGAERFRPALGRYVARHADGAADSDQFFATIGEATGEPALTESFRSFVEQAGVPLVEASLMCSAEAGPRVHLRQQRYRPLGSQIDPARQWVIPVCVGYAGDAAGDARRARDCTLLREREATLALSARRCPAWIVPNVDGAGYYRYSLDARGWDALLAAVAALTPTEALTLVDSAMAGFEGGELPAARLLEVVAMAADAEHRLVVTAPLARLERYADRLLDARARTRFLRWVGDLYRPRLAALAWARTEEERLLRTTLAEFLALTVRDPALRARLAADAAAFVGLEDAAPEPAALDADRYAMALTVGVQTFGAPFARAMLARREALDDPRYDAAAVAALGRAEDPSLREEVKAMALAGEFGTRETWSLVLALFEDPARRAATWDWYAAHFEALLPLIPEQWRRRTPRAAEAFCSAQDEAALTALFAEHGASVPGHQRPRAQVREGIRLCAALREAQGGALAGAVRYVTAAAAR